MSEIYRRYQMGEPINSCELNTKEGLELFGGRMWDDHLKDRNTAQYTLDSQLVWQKVKPIQKRIERPTEAQVSQERVDTFQKCQEWQIPLLVRPARIIKK